MRLLNLTTHARHLKTYFDKEFFMRLHRVIQPLILSLVLLLGALGAQAELQLFFVHNDHLGTPKYLTDMTGKAVWQAKSTPFGEVTEVEDLDGDGKYITLNMRFPGQYWDQETGTSYNYFRDYDPAAGRYVQSDPIGLRGGINTYSYAWSSPNIYFDFYGLKPGDRYSSPDAAGEAAIRDINPKSIIESVEYAGRIYKKADGSYSYTKPRKGTKDTSNAGSCPIFTQNAGDYHTHGGPLPGYDDENFADNDKDGNDSENVPGYLGTPTGKIKVYMPLPGSTRGGKVINLGAGAQ